MVRYAWIIAFTGSLIVLLSDGFGAPAAIASLIGGFGSLILKKKV
jgi:hypothetical protein